MLNKKGKYPAMGLKDYRLDRKRKRRGEVW